MQSYGGRDQAMGFYYDKLLKAGAVDEEFALYGFMYLENQETGFYVTGQEQKVFSALMQYEQQGIYCTPVLQKNYWAKVARGERQKIKRQYQFDMVKKLETMYGSTFFEVIARLCEVSSGDVALPVLTAWKTELDGSYDADLLHLYEATVAMAVQMKLLTAHTAEKLINWVQGLEGQLMLDELQQDGEAHTFTGLAWLDEKGEIHYQQYGKQDMAWKKRQKLMLEGNLVSPVFLKEMYYTATDFRVIQEKRQEFEQCMYVIMGNDYFDCLRTLYTLPSVVPETMYSQMLQTVEAICNPDEKTAFQLYSAQLRML